MDGHTDIVARLVRAHLGDAANRALAVLAIDPAIGAGEQVSRAQFAMAMNACLFEDLITRAPSGAAYVADRLAAGESVTFDHGAIRTILMPQGPTGALPPGEAAFARILGPLGYAVNGLYPLPRLKMTGRAYAHRDFPEAIPQFFVSELHVDQFDGAFAEVAARVFGTSRDPLGPASQMMLEAFAAGTVVPFAEALAALPEILAAFGRQHATPALDDYEALRTHSAEAAWIATEGNAFNHATDRVPHVEALAETQKAFGRPMKEKVEVSANGRVRQTAFRADPVLRRFVTPEGEVEREVPGSFYEFITRDIDPATGTLDLGFDSGNATGIFAMTKAA